MSTRSGELHPFPYELLGTALLTGLRKSELLGLTRSDLDFDRRTVTVRPNEFRGLKTQTAHRVVPMPTQLVEILQSYTLGDEPRIGLLFPSPHTGRMVTDCRKLLDRLAGRIGLEEGRVRLHGLRHTFCAAALQTLDRGKPISKYTVAMWMGHGGTSLVNRIYGHLGEHRHRGDEVEFRVDQHRQKLGDQLRKLRAS